MIYKLRDKLKDYLLTEGTISARIIDIDDFSFQQVTPNLVVARWDLIKWDVIDHDENEGRAIERFNNEMREFLASKLRELSFSRYNTDIRIIEQRFYC